MSTKDAGYIEIKLLKYESNLSCNICAYQSIKYSIYTNFEVTSINNILRYLQQLSCHMQMSLTSIGDNL